ncbi:MAG TPA: DNA-protecting protein DprA [Piscirickettsiaceae bacterium]|nr:DNA-protecting protein DprA [Piscirickettsiaceae bacterium]HIQ40912.1 DNA-protecting protein DprA [Sulfurivirga caldicuralii]
MTQEQLRFWNGVLHAQLNAQQLKVLPVGEAGLSEAELVRRGLSPSQAQRFVHGVAQADELARWLAGGTNRWLMTCTDADWPKPLAQIGDAPAVLLGLGRRTLLGDPQLAVVGARHASREGVANAEAFAEALSQAGLTITSGLAHGIDAAAHRGALKGVGSTIAVMGTGIDRIYPAVNRQLAHQIAEAGAIVSEFPLGAPPRAAHFPRRNRIVSGLSAGTLVVEAHERSGSLITARLASQQGREVFAIPGSIHNPMAKGCHRLIKQGAKLVECAQDILEELADLLRPQLALVDEDTRQIPALSEAETTLLAHIPYDPISLDELAVLTRWPVSQLQGGLLSLEMAGCVMALPGGLYKRIC